MSALPAILLALRLGFAPAPPTATPTPASATMSRGDARKLLVDLNREWGKARVGFDRPTFERMLAPDFYVQLSDRRINRQEFLDEISKPSPRARLSRFDVEVLTVEQDGDVLVAVIEEKLELVPADGRPTAYNLWVTRDRWKKFGDQWKALSSEAIGNELWRNGEKPPVRDW